MEGSIGERIKQARKSKNLTQLDLSKKVDLSQNYIYLIESGRESPGKNAVKDIASALNVTQQWILTGEEPMTPPPENEVAAYVDELLGDDENPLYDLIRAIMKTYSELGPDDQKIIKSFAKNLKDNQNSEIRG